MMWLGWNTADSHFISSITFFFLPPAHPSPPKSKSITGSSQSQKESLLDLLAKIKCSICSYQSQKELGEAGLPPPASFAVVLSPLWVFRDTSVRRKDWMGIRCMAALRGSQQSVVPPHCSAAHRDVFFMNQNRFKIFF